MYSFENRSAASSDWVSPAATRSWRSRVPRPELARCGVRKGMRMRPSMVRQYSYRRGGRFRGSLARVTRTSDSEPPRLGSAGLVQLRVDRTGGLRGNARDPLELLLRGGEEALGRAEMLQ